VQKRFAWENLAAALLLWAFFAQAVTGMVVQSPTIDEQAHLMRGILYVKTGDEHFKFGHPILAEALSGAPVAALTAQNVPADDPAYHDNNWSDFSERFIWQPGNNIDRIFFLGRWPTVALTMLLAAFVFRWARELWGSGAGLIALALFSFDPTIVAHSQLITHDVPVAVFFFIAAYGLWRYLERNQSRNLVFAGVAFGLAQSSKFAALLLVPVFIFAVSLWPFIGGVPASERMRWLAKRAAGLLAIFAIGGLTVWAVYHFEFGPLAESFRFKVWNLRFDFSVPAPAYFENLRWESKYFDVQRDFYFCGQYGAGWWYYFPVAFLIKSPLPAMTLIGASAIGLFRGAKKWSRLVALLLPAGAYIAATLVSPLYIGYRYFIPALPFLYVLAGRLATLAGRRSRLALVGALVWSAAIAVWIHPYDLSYFNELIGGPDNGWRCLTDSNIDWGQDLPALRDVIERYGLGKIKLSYFGRAFPSYYGIDFEPLTTYYGTPEQGNPLTSPFYPFDPAPGVYALSVTNMRGVGMLPQKWHLYDWFLDKRPFAKAGYSIFLYRVEPKGRPVDVALSGLQVDEIALKTYAEFGTNDTRLRWFDADTSLMLPVEPSWYVVDKGDLAAWGWNTAQPCSTVDGRTCRLYPPDPKAHAAELTSVERMSAASRAWANSALLMSLSLPANLGNEVQFLGYDLQRPTPGADQLSLQLAWRVLSPVQGPRTIFVHLLAPDGQIVSQWDGFGVAAEGWHAGDTFIQRASLALPQVPVTGDYWIQVGMYNPETMQRLSVLEQGKVITDRILIAAIRLK
jgi:hypothetical protein